MFPLMNLHLDKSDAFLERVIRIALRRLRISEEDYLRTPTKSLKHFRVLVLTWSGSSAGKRGTCTMKNTIHMRANSSQPISLTTCLANRMSSTPWVIAKILRKQ